MTCHDRGWIEQKLGGSKLALPQSGDRSSWASSTVYPRSYTPDLSRGVDVKLIACLWSEVVGFKKPSCSNASYIGILNWERGGFCFAAYAKCIVDDYLYRAEFVKKKKKNKKRNQSVGNFQEGAGWQAISANSAECRIAFSAFPWTPPSILSFIGAIKARNNLPTSQVSKAALC